MSKASMGFVAIDPGWFSLAAAEDSALDALPVDRVLVRLRPRLLDLARTLALESTADYPNGPLFWNEVLATSSTT